MVPGFLRGYPRHGQGDRPYTALRNADLDLLNDFDEMVPLKRSDDDDGGRNDVITDTDDDDDVNFWPQDISQHKKNGVSGRGAARLSMKQQHHLHKSMSRDDSKSGDIELNRMDSPSGSQQDRSFTQGLRQSILPSAAIAADIAHYPLVLEEGEGCTIDDLIREDVQLHPERMRAVAFQILIPFLVAGLGMVAAGMVLDKVQHWEVFDVISELFVMVPALLGLKGNLEMTLAARLSTALNTGSLTAAKRWKIIGANLALTQAQAVVVGFMASMFAVFIGFITHHTVDWSHALLLCGAASATTSIASSALGAVMVGVILLSEKWKINPDNIATPIAASLGDVITLGVLSGFSYLFYSVYDTKVWFVGPTVVLLIVWSLLPLWIYITKHVAQTRIVLKSGWIPVISAMLISSGAGTILEKIQVLSRNVPAYKYFLGLPVFQPVMNGVAGNLVAVQASRISTHLHMAYGEPGNFPGDFYVCPNPFYSFCARNYMNARTARVLLLILIPGHLIFIFAISIFKGGHTTVTLKFVVVFIFVALIQVAILLYIAEFLTHFVWKRGIDPDSFTIPYLTSLGDLSGTALLVFAFWFLYVTGDRDSDVGY